MVRAREVEAQWRKFKLALLVLESVLKIVSNVSQTYELSEVVYP